MDRHRSLIGMTLVSTLLTTSVWLTPEALASAPPEETPAAAPSPPQPAVKPKVKGIPLIVVGSVLMTGGAASGIAMMFLSTGDGLAGGSGWTPTTTGLAIGFSCSMITGTALLLGGFVWRSKSIKTAQANATALRWQPTLGFSPSGGQIGLQLRF